MSADPGRWVVPVAALAAFLMRLPGIAEPASSDEAGFTLVARAWDPQPESVYGHYFVDRSPLLIAIFRIADEFGTPWGVRLLGALAAALTVLLIARAARLVSTATGARWSAVLTATLVATPLIDPISAKGELLALPFIALSVWTALRAVRGPIRWPALEAGVAGASGMLAVAMKQNLVGGLVFAAVLLLMSRLSGDLSRQHLIRTGTGLVAGALLPPLATLGWALAMGIRPATLWYTLYGFRADASEVLTVSPGTAAYERLGELLLAALVAGIIAALAVFLVSLRQEWRTDRPATSAIAAMVLVDLVGFAMSGSFWRDYLLPLIPGAALAIALLTRQLDRPGILARGVVGFATASALGALVIWQTHPTAQAAVPGNVSVGRAVAAAAEPGDSLVVFGGKAEVQLASGLPSPYRHLWSLPMRTLDPEYDDLTEVLRGPDAPVWLVQWWPFDLWNAEAGRRLDEVVAERYVVHGSCGGKTIHLRADVERPSLVCD